MYSKEDKKDEKNTWHRKVKRRDLSKDEIKELFIQILEDAKSTSSPSCVIGLTIQIETFLGRNYDLKKHYYLYDSINLAENVDDMYIKGELLRQCASHLSSYAPELAVKLYEQSYQIFRELPDLEHEISNLVQVALAIRWLDKSKGNLYLSNTARGIMEIKDIEKRMDQEKKFLKTMMDINCKSGISYLIEFLDNLVYLIKSNPALYKDFMYNFSNIEVVCRDYFEKCDDLTVDDVERIHKSLLKFDKLIPDECIRIRFTDNVLEIVANALNELVSNYPDKAIVYLHKVYEKLRKTSPLLCDDEGRYSYYEALSEIYMGFIRHSIKTFKQTPERNAEFIKSVLREVDNIPYKCIKNKICSDFRSELREFLFQSFKEENDSFFLLLEVINDKDSRESILEETFSNYIISIKKSKKHIDPIMYYIKYKPFFRSKIKLLRILIDENTEEEFVCGFTYRELSKITNEEDLPPKELFNLMNFIGKIFKLCPEKFFTLVEDILHSYKDTNDLEDDLHFLIHDAGYDMMMHSPERTFKIIDEFHQDKCIFSMKNLITRLANENPDMAVNLLKRFRYCITVYELGLETLKILTDNSSELAWGVFEYLQEYVEMHEECKHKELDILIGGLHTALKLFKDSDFSKVLYVLKKLDEIYDMNNRDYLYLSRRYEILWLLQDAIKYCPSENIDELVSILMRFGYDTPSSISNIGGSLSDTNPKLSFSLFSTILNKISQLKNNSLKLILIDNVSSDIAPLPKKERNTILKKCLKISENIKDEYLSNLLFINIGKNTMVWDIRRGKKVIQKALTRVERMKNNVDRDALLSLISLELAVFDVSSAIMVCKKIRNDNTRIMTLYDVIMKNIKSYGGL